MTQKNCGQGYIVFVSTTLSFSAPPATHAPAAAVTLLRLAIAPVAPGKVPKPGKSGKYVPTRRQRGLNPRRSAVFIVDYIHRKTL
jgi:hypothetical protein